MKKRLSAGATVRTARPTHEEIRAAAYHLYLEKGCQDGHDVDDWLRAEMLLSEQLWAGARDDSSESSTNGVLRLDGIRPMDQREQFLPTNEQESASREKTRRRTTPFRTASR